jgi:DnaJ-domain-containing protein 1
VRRQRILQAQREIERQWAAEFLALKEREYQEQLRKQMFEAFLHERKREAPPPKAPPQPDMVSFYRNLLGLKLRFTKEELKTAHREAVKKYHPDTYAGASKRDRENALTLMKQVNEAYEVLKSNSV